MSKINWDDKKVLVTGAGGFIGSHLVEKLLNMNIYVRAFIRYTSQGSIGNLRHIRPNNNLEIFYGDLKNPFAVKKALKDINYVFHLASLISIPYSYVNPREYFDNNVYSILNLLSSIEEMGTEFIVHSSTSEAYGSAQYVPIDEKHPLVGQSPYSASKIAADKVVESHFLSFDTPIATLRPFNTYGPRQTNRAVIPTIIIQLLQSNELKLGDLTPTRDFLFVKDNIEAFLKAIEHQNKVKGMTINIGTGQEISIESVTKKLINIIKPDAKISVDESKLRPTKSEVRRLCADNTLAKSILNWAPTYTLEEGLKKTVEWVQNNPTYYKNQIAYK
jgi:dTDP-glucose 4,6-dehydratase